MLGHKGQDAAFALDGQAVCVGDDLNRVNVPASKSIHRVENLEGSNQIEFINWRHYDDEDPAARAVSADTRILV